MLGVDDSPRLGHWTVVQQEQSVIYQVSKASSVEDVLLSFQHIAGQSPYLENHGVRRIGAGMEGRIVFVLQPGEDSVIAPSVDFGDKTAHGIEAYFALHFSVIKDNLIPHLMTCPTMSLYILDRHFDSVETFGFLHGTDFSFRVFPVIKPG
jgi:hypothetical protein